MQFGVQVNVYRTSWDEVRASPKQYVIDRLGEFRDAGIAEVMFGGIRSGDVDRLGEFEEEIVAAFR